MGDGKRAVRIAIGKNRPIHRGNQNAQAIVELALILPILLVLIVGALEFGRLWSTKIILTNAAREGAYFYSTHGNSKTCPDALTKTASKDEANSSGITLSDSNITISGNCKSGSKVIVTASYTVKDLLVLGFIGNVFHLTGTVTDFPLSSKVEMMVQ